MEFAFTTLLWVLGIMFLAAGGMKLAMPPERLAERPNMEWAARTDATRVRLAGASELAAALAFIGAALGLVPDWLAGLAAVGIVAVMVMAAVQVHQPADEPITMNVVLGILAATTAVLAFAG